MNCRFCSSQLTHTFLDLGCTPLSNAFLKPEQLNMEKSFPLHAYVCEKCFLVQIDKFEPPENIFSNEYAYFSSYSDSWLKHVENYTKNMIKRFSLTSNSLIIEIASNDGYLLQFFKRENIPVLGIEPASNVAEKARKKNIETISSFFGKKLANELSKKGTFADLLIGNNVFAHVPDLNDFVSSLKIILKPNGIITMEFPYLLQLIKNREFDTVYHEHFSYFSFYTVSKIFEHHGLKIFDVEELSTHGGSLRIYATHKENTRYTNTPNINKLLEKDKNLQNLTTYDSFSNSIYSLRHDIIDYISTLRKNEKTIVAYGAAAKGNTLLNFCNLDKNSIQYIVDKNPHKQGMLTPGTHIEIKDPSEIKKTKPDYVLILPWNIKDEIISQMNFIKEWGGKFIILIPNIEIYS